MIPNILPYMIMIDDYLGICFYMHLYATKQVKQLQKNKNNKKTNAKTNKQKTL